MASDATTAWVASLALLCTFVATYLAAVLRFTAHKLDEKSLIDMMLSLLAALAAATVLPVWRWLQIVPAVLADGERGASGNRDSASFTSVLVPVMVATSLLQLGMISMWILYRRQLMVDAAAQREQDQLRGIALLNEARRSESPNKAQVRRATPPAHVRASPEPASARGNIFTSRPHGAASSSSAGTTLGPEAFSI